MSNTAQKKSLTIFKSDRHEDFAAITLAAIVVISVLIYMAYIAPTVVVKADSDGTLRAIHTTVGSMVKTNDPLYTIAVTEKKWKNDKVEESVKEKVIKAKTNGKILNIMGTVNATVKKGKNPILELEHEKGTLP